MAAGSRHLIEIRAERALMFPMFERIFRWFETRIDAYAPAPITEPPKRLAAFFWFYLKPVTWAFAALTVLTLAAAGIEVAIIAFIGRIIDLMRETSSPSQFFAEHGPRARLHGLRGAHSTTGPLRPHRPDEAADDPGACQRACALARALLRACARASASSRTTLPGASRRGHAGRPRGARRRRQRVRRRRLGGGALDRRVPVVLRGATGGSSYRSPSGSPATR